MKSPMAHPLQSPMAHPMQSPMAHPLQSPMAHPMQSPMAHPIQSPTAHNESGTESSFVLLLTKLWQRAPKEVLSFPRQTHALLLFTLHCFARDPLQWSADTTVMQLLLLLLVSCKRRNAFVYKCNPPLLFLDRSFQ
jgi:hypothetical protein